MKKMILISSMMIVVLSISSLALARPGFGPGGEQDCSGRGQGPMSIEQHEERAERHLARMTAVLELNEDQQQQIRALLDQQWQNRQQQQEQMQAARDAMHAALSADKFDEADFRAKAAKHDKLRADRMVERVQLQQKINAVLTPEQQAKADELAGLRGGPKGNCPKGKGCGPGKGMRPQRGCGDCF